MGLFSKNKKEDTEQEEPRIQTVKINDPFLIPETEIPENQMQEFINGIEQTRVMTNIITLLENVGVNLAGKINKSHFL